MTRIIYYLNYCVYNQGLHYIISSYCWCNCSFDYNDLQLEVVNRLHESTCMVKYEEAIKCVISIFILRQKMPRRHPLPSGMFVLLIFSILSVCGLKINSYVVLVPTGSDQTAKPREDPRRTCWCGLSITKKIV